MFQILDGFYAHEVMTVVPQAVNGEKDEVDSNGDPQWIIPEAEIDEVFAQKHTFYIFKTQSLWKRHI